MRQLKKVILATLVLCMLLTAVVLAAPGDRDLSVGMQGDDVFYLQRILTDAGFYMGDLDGVFGSQTKRAVREFQQSNDLEANGVATNLTFKYLSRYNVEPDRYTRSLNMRATAYSAYDPGCGSYTAGGHLVRKGLVAVDPSVIPLGTRLYIVGYGFAVADDTGGSIQGDRIDLAFESRADAIQFGVRDVLVYILD